MIRGCTIQGNIRGEQKEFKYIGNVKENISINQQGKDLFIAFNARYFMEAFRTNNDEFVKIKFNSSSNPCVVVPASGNEEYLYLILPVRIL